MDGKPEPQDGREAGRRGAGRGDGERWAARGAVIVAGASRWLWHDGGGRQGDVYDISVSV